MAKKGLGRGLGALIDTSDDELITAPAADETASSGITYMKLSNIEPRKNQPRKNFDKEKIKALSKSIKENGLIQPIIVCKNDIGIYQIVAGERRWRAAREAGLKEIPVLVREYDDKEIASVALIENLQREDLNPIEEALGYSLLIEEFSMTQDEVAKQIGKSRSAVANSLRLLALEDDIRNALINGTISSGHARAILSLDDTDMRHALLDKIIENNLNVRQAEALSKQLLKKKPKKERAVLDEETKNAIENLSERLTGVFGTKVKISSNGKKGKIEIDYFDNDDLERILKLFKL